jgi:hypothetical protein
MTTKPALTLLAVGCMTLAGVTLPGAVRAASEADCAAQWTDADANHDGVLVGVEASRYLAYIRVRSQVVPPADGRITQDSFMQACRNDTFMVKEADPDAPLKGTNSFTEEQAKDRAVAAGLTHVSNLSKDRDGIWRGNAMKGNQIVKVAIDFKGNVVTY